MALQGFVELAPSVLSYEPPSPRVGQLVVIAVWMGAQEKHIAKYTSLYQNLLPTVRILLIKCTVSSMIVKYKTLQKALTPAADYVRRVIEECDENASTEPHVLVQMFSNGGINLITQILVVLSGMRNRPTPLVGLICNSTPAGVGYWKDYSAFRNALPQGFLFSILAPPFIHFLLIYIVVTVSLGINEIPQVVWRRSILDENLVDTKRITYIASKADKIIGWKDVVSHAQEARKKGWEVREIIYENTRHCNHLQKDPQAYEDMVRDMWGEPKR